MFVNFFLHVGSETNDAVILEGTITVLDNDTYMVMLEVMDDNIIEGNETYTVQIRSDNPLDTTDSTQTFIIIDNDGECYI